MKIILDAMSGDNAPGEIIEGAALAVKELDVNIRLVGDEKIIKKYMYDHVIPPNRIEIVHTDKIIKMDDDPMSIAWSNKDSSMGVCLKLLATGGGDAMVSAGNTGAILTGATLIVRRLPGIKRAALATIMPFEKVSLLLDIGANVECRPEYLVQFAVMGKIYMNKLFGIDNPTVGLINNGTEKSKGTPLQTATYELLSAAEDINFTGNVETRTITTTPPDVMVTDGFTGNIILKLCEGFGDYLSIRFKKLFMDSALTKVAAIFVKNGIKDMKRALDPTEYGGVPLLGISRPVIKAHGSSNAKAIKNAIKQAKEYIRTGINEEIEKYVEKSKAGDNAGQPKPEEKE
ncbi:MAG: phosphate acyltransferase PlsX [Eubacteriales bacterium]